MAQNVTIAGNQYPSVPSIQIPKTGGGGNATFTDTSPTTASASDVAQGKIFFDSTGTQQTGTSSGGGGTDFIVTLSYDSQSDMWTPDKTLAEIAAAYGAEKDIATYAYNSADDTIQASGGYYEDGADEFWYWVNNSDTDAGGDYTISSTYCLNSNGVTLDEEIKSYNTMPATALPADVANGKIFFNASGMQTGTASGGGGASNVVTGTFKGTTANTAIDLSLGYTGNGYPIAFVIYPEEGPYNSSSGSFYSLVQRYAMAMYCGVKCNQNTAPAYSNQAGVDYYSTLLKYKSSASSATSYSQAGSTEGGSYYDIAAAAGTSSCVKIRSKAKMSVFIKDPSSGYGFAANITYRYVVLYSQ